jgi:D-inositol-3-phosphate glycosyltransferase
LPELREAFGLVVLEAKVAGIPSVVLQSGALPDLVRHGVDGWVCEAPTAAAIAAALKYYFDDPATRVRHGAAAAAHARTFDREHFARGWREELGLVIDPVASAATAEPRMHRHG